MLTGTLSSEHVNLRGKIVLVLLQVVEWVWPLAWYGHCRGLHLAGSVLGCLNLSNVRDSGEQVVLVHWFLLANKRALRCSTLCMLQTKLHEQVLASALGVNLLLTYLLLQL